MITRQFDININNDKSSSLQKIVLYKGDSGLLLHLILKNFKFNINNGVLSKVDASILNKSDNSITSLHNLSFIDKTKTIVLQINNGNLVLRNTGIYCIQLHLYDENNNRISVPPFDIEVRDTIY